MSGSRAASRIGRTASASMMPNNAGSSYHGGNTHASPTIAPAMGSDLSSKIDQAVPRKRGSSPCAERTTAGRMPRSQSSSRKNITDIAGPKMPYASGSNSRVRIRLLPKRRTSCRPCVR